MKLNQLEIKRIQIVMELKLFVIKPNQLVTEQNNLLMEQNQLVMEQKQFGMEQNQLGAMSKQSVWEERNIYLSWTNYIFVCHFIKLNRIFLGEKMNSSELRIS